MRSPTAPRDISRPPGYRYGAALLAASLLMLIAAGTGTARRVPTGSSTNWSGYVVAGASFNAVEATWVEPPVTCSLQAMGATAASFWVGLGGNSGSQNGKIEQIGTDSDCNSKGHDSYYAWYELFPADSVNLTLPIEPGDRIRASVSVQGDNVVLAIRNLTSQRGASRRLALRAPDRSSAEWIVEAPSFPVGGDWVTSGMANFGSVRFTGATATAADGRSGPIIDRAWQAQAIGFASENPGTSAGAITRLFDQMQAAWASPSSLDPRGSAFTVTWRPGYVSSRSTPRGAL